MSLSWLVGIDPSRCTTSAAFERSHAFVADVDTYLINERRYKLLEYAGMKFDNSRSCQPILRVVVGIIRSICRRRRKLFSSQSNLA